jgi:DNA modification methylase
MFNLSLLRKKHRNPRKITGEQLAVLKKSVSEFSKMLPLRPIIYDPATFEVLGGNQRLEALLQLGYKSVPAEWVRSCDDFTEDEKRRFVIADNVGFGEWDDDILRSEWDVAELKEWGLELPVFDEIVENEFNGDDFSHNEGLKTDIILGDLFEIGQHRLICGDSTDIDTVLRLANGEKIDMVFTDPPYGVSIVKKNGKVGGGGIVEARSYSPIIGDDSTDTAKCFYETCIRAGFVNYIIWGGNYFTDFLPPSMCWIVWNKKNGGTDFADFEMAWTSYKKAARLYDFTWSGMIREGKIENEGRGRVHPTQKPVGLFMNIFADFDFEICYDGFLGSGSTMVAAHQTQKKCYGIELSPEYCQTIIDRMRKLQPDIIVKKNGIEM